tara:strand:+ start:801 stop:1142 length:342 start_codon:yes stop_codon:yes gene_type:complete
MDNETKHKIEGQAYSNNVIESMQDILNIEAEEERQEQVFNYGLSISKQTVINYLISWGGPAYRLQITFDEGQIIKVVPQYQDWFTEWTTIPTTSKQNTTLLNFVYELGLEELI